MTLVELKNYITSGIVPRDFLIIVDKDNKFLLELEVFDKQGLFLYPFRILEGYKNHIEGHIIDSKEFKELFVKKYKEGLTARKILTDCGYNPEIFGDRRVQGISHHIRKQYEETGGIFTEGHTSCRKPRIPPAQLSEKEELKQLRQEVDYLKQEIEFLKKISSIRTTRK